MVDKRELMMQREDELARLLSLAADTRLDELDPDFLDDLLDSPEGDENYLRFIDLHFRLIEQNSPVRDFSAEELRAVSLVDDRFKSLDQSESHPLTPCAPAKKSGLSLRSMRQVHWWSLAGGLAASMLFFLLYSSLLGPGSLSGQQESSTIAKIGESSPSLQSVAKVDSAARIVRKIDCDWSADRWGISDSERVQIGQWINLASGLLVLELPSGTQVTLQGPVSASLDTENSMRLAYGGLTAKVPESGKGFIVETTAGKIVDLGTEFGVLARRDGSLETHVFKGQVVSHLDLTGADASETKFSLTEGQSQIVSSKGQISSSRADPGKFLQLGFGADFVRADSPPIERGISLWLSASGRIHLDDQGRVAAWGDNPTPANDHLEDSWQVHENLRPRWAKNAVNGHPAIHFGGDTKLISEPVELGSNITAILVFRLESDRVPVAYSHLLEDANQNKTRPDLGLQLLNLYGPPHPVIQIDEDLSLKGRVHLGWNPEKIRGNDAGVTSTRPVVDDMPHVVCYTFDSLQSKASLYLDGQLQDVADSVPNLDSTYTPRFIGQHPYRPQHGFPGYISEVMLYDVALDTKEIVSITNWLCDRYEIVAYPSP